MSNVKLSICIPVYNCAEFLGAALDSILPQAGSGVEVLIYDGASTDQTSVLVRDYQRSAPAIRYIIAAVRGGIDTDMAACISEARGEYCWLFSGDDVMSSGSVARLLQRLSPSLDVCVLEHTLCNLTMNVYSRYPVLSPNIEFDADLSDPSQREQWFRRARNTEAFFSFISGLVVRREAWMSGTLFPEFNGSCWAHVARLFALMKSGLRVAYLPGPWLDQRGGNDSFRQSGIIERYRLAIEGFQRIVDRFFSSDSIEAFHVRRVLRNEFELKMLVAAKLLAAQDPSGQKARLLGRLVAALYADGSLSSRGKRLVFRLMNPSAIRVAIKVWWLFHKPRSGQAKA